MDEGDLKRTTDHRRSQNEPPLRASKLFLFFFFLRDGWRLPRVDDRRSVWLAEGTESRPQQR